MQFNLQGYTVEQRTKANIDLRSYLKKTALKLPYAEIPCDSVRAAEVNRVCEEFYAVFGQFPDSTNLYYLSNYVLLLDIRSTNKWKSRNKYAFLSPRQWRYRYSKEFPAETKVVCKYRTSQMHNMARAKRRYNYE